MIILAHVSPPQILFQMRNFDVPLMVMVSGMSFGLTFKDRDTYPGYVWKRIKRIIFPLWIFLTAYFSVVALVNPASRRLSTEVVVNSYFLIGDIEYLWIMRVFFLVALLAPLIYQLNEKIRSDGRFFIYLALGFVVSEGIRFLCLPYAGTIAGDAFIYLIFQAFAYSLLFALGLRLLRMEGKRKVLMLYLASVAAFVCMFVYLWKTEGKIMLTQSYKYPPSVYYFSYAVAVSAFLWMIGDQVCKLVRTIPALTHFVVFVSRNSMWIYLWHIPCVRLIHTHFALKYILVLSIATSLTFIQTWLVTRVIAPKIQDLKVRRTFENLLMG